MDTGFTTQDAQNDFSKARRRQVFSDLAGRVRGGGEVGTILPFDEVIAAVGRRGERRLGLQVIPLDSIVGTVDRSRREFDRSFRPTSRRVRQRWERIAKAMRRGESLPPISVYRVGDVHFVEDGHHRVSVARALGLTEIEAYVTEIITAVGVDTSTTLAELMFKSHQRLFNERVPLPPEARDQIVLGSGYAYALLAEGVEAWGFRAIQATGELLDREQIALRWFEDEYLPVIATLREADMLGDGTETEAYMRAVSLRYMLVRTHDWNDDVLARLREGIERPPAGVDTQTHEVRRQFRR
ncbi:ParB N-terminal domain-containing protein [Thermoleophilia bacterium SCSIO 60948]|nr:ParB N-terminal domain-containing protein [Thermoleophilia bacterium SCSIO 60948]